MGKAVVVIAMHGTEKQFNVLNREIPLTEHISYVTFLCKIYLHSMFNSIFFMNTINLMCLMLDQ